MKPRPDPEVTSRAESRPAGILGGSVILLELESFRDHRGVLSPLDFGALGFEVARAFVVRAPDGAVRGGHGHERVRQVLFRASGAIDLDLRRQGEHARLTLDEDTPAVLLEPGVWAQQTYVGVDSTLIVFADGAYDPAEYIHTVSTGKVS
jgi:dTDP-4-dehydrorhamnose 3,5-epimerase-like enzyme